MEIGPKIKRLRIQLGLTQEELANRCELSKGFISQLERDLTSPSIATLIDILECLGTSPRAFSLPAHIAFSASAAATHVLLLASAPRDAFSRPSAAPGQRRQKETADPRALMQKESAVRRSGPPRGRHARSYREL